jgi:hypothetical protein
MVPYLRLVDLFAGLPLLRTHPTIVPHRARGIPIATQIDTQQLPTHVVSGAGERRVAQLARLGRLVRCDDGHRGDVT